MIHSYIEIEMMKILTLKVTYLNLMKYIIQILV